MHNNNFINNDTILELKELGNGDGDFSNRLLVVQLMSLYLENLPERMNALASAIQIQEAHSIETSAHSLKSSSRLIGLLSLADLCQNLEDLGHTKNLIKTKDIFSEIQQNIKNIENEIKNKIQELES
jgi:HPt (histidine-containing phosphotransfer) domain-containing protein